MQKTGLIFTFKCGILFTGDIDDYIKTVGYAYLYKGLGKSVNEIPHSELTVTLVRDVLPEGLFKSIEAEGGTIRENYPGIYHISGFVGIPTQFVLTNKLDKNMHTSLRILTDQANEDDVERFLEGSKLYYSPEDKRNIDALLSVSISANKEVYKNVIRRNKNMSDAMKELIDELFHEEKRDAIDDSLVAAIKNLMNNSGWDADKAMNNMGIPESDQIRYAARL